MGPGLGLRAADSVRRAELGPNCPELFCCAAALQKCMEDGIKLRLALGWVPRTAFWDYVYLIGVFRLKSKIFVL